MFLCGCFCNAVHVCRKFTYLHTYYTDISAFTVLLCACDVVITTEKTNILLRYLHQQLDKKAVSYTHLTLPTNREV